MRIGRSGNGRPRWTAAQLSSRAARGDEGRTTVGLEPAPHAAGRRSTDPKDVATCAARASTPRRPGSGMLDIPLCCQAILKRVNLETLGTLSDRYHLVKEFGDTSLKRIKGSSRHIPNDFVSLIRALSRSSRSMRGCRTRGSRRPYVPVPRTFGVREQWNEQVLGRRILLGSAAPCRDGQLEKALETDSTWPAAPGRPGPRSARRGPSTPGQPSPGRPPRQRRRSPRNPQGTREPRRRGR